MCGNYESGRTSPGEASSTYEGRIITVLESEITHPTHDDGLVDKYDPVMVGDSIVGVAMSSAAAATDLIAVDTEDIWYLPVNGTDESGDVAVAPGDVIWISSACALSKDSSGRPFGWALGTVASGASGTYIAVKVHGNQGQGFKVVDFISQTVAIGDFTDNTDATGYVDLTPTLPAGAMPLGCKFVVATGFTGDTTAVVQAGVAGDLDRFTADTAQSVLAAATVGSLAIAADACDGINAAATVRVTVTGAADFGNISAGQMTVYVYFVRT